MTHLAFAPDGRHLLSGLTDSTFLIWDTGRREKCPAGKLGPEGLKKACADLAGADAPRALRRAGRSPAAPEEALPNLKEWLRTARPADAPRMHQLLADLDSDQFEVKDKAQGELVELGDLAEPSLRQALLNKPTLEVRKRVEAVLERLHEPVTRPEILRSLARSACWRTSAPQRPGSCSRNSLPAPTSPARRRGQGLLEPAPLGRFAPLAKNPPMSHFRRGPARRSAGSIGSFGSCCPLPTRKRCGSSHFPSAVGRRSHPRVNQREQSRCCGCRHGDGPALGSPPGRHRPEKRQKRVSLTVSISYCHRGCCVSCARIANESLVGAVPVLPKILLDAQLRQSDELFSF